MGKLIKLILLLLIIGLGLLAWSHAPIRLEVTTERSIPGELPPANPPAGMSLSVLATGQMQAGQAFAYRGGSFLKENESAMDAALIQHPRGDLLIDTGFGRNVDAHVATTPWLMRTLAKYQLNGAVADQLADGGYPLEQLKGVIITHAHWDHVSGLPDMPGIPVWANKAERDFIHHGGEHSALARSFGDAVSYRHYEFSDGPYMGYESSLDVYDDGSIVLVPMRGHTPGSTGVFVNLPSNKRYFFIGDIVWAREGYERPAERPFMARNMIGEDGEAVRSEVVHVHRLHNKFPQLTIVPAHDRRQFAGMAAFPAVSR